MNVRSRRLFMILSLITLLAVPAFAQVMKETNDALDGLAYVDERIVAQQLDMVPVEDSGHEIELAVSNSWHEFLANHGEWKGQVDRRSGRIDFAEGDGIPWVPGRGNSLTSRQKPDLSTLESISRSFIPEVAHLLGVDIKSLKLNQGRSGNPADYLWYVDYDVEIDGLPVDGARVVFRVNHGNLIQFGTENLPAPNARAPRAKLTRKDALAALSAYVGGMRAGDTFVDGGSQRLMALSVDGDVYEVGKGRGLTRVWQFVFRRADSHGTWRVRVDAVTGEVLEFRDINEYAQVTGGVKFLGVPQNRPLPFANVSSGGFTNSAGVYTWPGGTVTSTLNGQYVRISDNCGSISQSANGSGDILFGGTSGTDCSTPGSGGAGNTFSARGQFYHVNRAKEIARGWLPSNTWLNAQLTANVNINLTCNAFWNGSTINFYRSGGGCGNTGEIEGVSLHEYGHGLDSNDGNGSSPENGTGETYGDFTAALATHTSCVGSGFLTSNCGGYGDACTSCTGVRDIDWAKHASNTPHTVANFTQTRCPTSGIGYVGPCNREGHCESYISSEALWDLAARDMPNPGSGAAWAAVDRLWYLSRSTATRSFTCTTSTSPWTSNGCNTGSLWKVLRAVDDDNGNLADGTPNSGALFAAFNRHGIACTTDAGANVSFRGCTQPAVPTLSVTAGSNSASLSWSGSSGVYDVYRTENGCNSGFTKISNDLAATSLVDNAVANGFTYYYQVAAQPSGNEACASAPSSCVSVTPAGAPCTPPAAPTGLTATAAGQTQINLAWTAVSGATSYNIYRSATSGGPYTQVGTSTTPSFSNTGLTCNTPYFYVVRAATTCESGNSNQATATTSVCTGCTTQTLYSKNFDTDTGLAGWSTGTFVTGGSTVDWRGVQTCTAQSGANIFRFGGTTCTGDYGSSRFAFAQPNGTAGIAVPAGSNTTRLSFWHRRAFETGYDGGTLTVSVNGTNYFYVPASAIVSGTTYNGTSSTSCPPTGGGGRSIFTGTASTFTNTTVNLDAACNLATGGTGGCAGQSVRIGFTAITDCSVVSDGWFIDTVTVTACQ